MNFDRRLFFQELVAVCRVYLRKPAADTSVVMIKSSNRCCLFHPFVILWEEREGHGRSGNSEGRLRVDANAIQFINCVKNSKYKLYDD